MLVLVVFSHRHMFFHLPMTFPLGLQITTIKILVEQIPSGISLPSKLVYDYVPITVFIKTIRAIMHD